MKHHTVPAFWLHYQQLPDHIQKLADKNFQILKANNEHPSIKFKKIGKIRSARVGMTYRALATTRGDDVFWFWIGTHANYDKLLKGTHQS